MTEPDSIGNPSDFHHITAHLKIPLAPVFLTKPSSSKQPYRNNPTQDPLNLKSASEPAEQNPETIDHVNLSNQAASSGPLEAVNQSIASLLMKYIPSLGSVLVAYLQPPIFILHDEYGRKIRRVANQAHQLSIPTVPGIGWGVIDVEVRLMGWRPTIGQKLIGRPTLSSPSHLSLVVYQTFNATIHENHLKSAGCYYDPNAQVPRSWQNPTKNGAATENPWESQADSSADEHRECGCWVNAHGKIVGGDDGTVSFTVISLTVANHMISVIGSLLDDPFSIETEMPPTQPIPENVPSRIRAQSSDESSSVDYREEQQPPNTRQRSTSDDDEEEDRPNTIRISSSSNRLKSPPHIKSASQAKASMIVPESSSSGEDESPSGISQRPRNVEHLVGNSRSGQTIKTPRKKKLKRSAPGTDDLPSNSSSPTTHPTPPSKNSTLLPTVKRRESIKPKFSSTPSKKKLKTK